MFWLRSKKNNFQIYALLGQVKKISVFRVTGLKILGRVGTLIFFNYFFSGKNIILCILPIETHKITFFFRKPEKTSMFHQKSGYPKHRYFFIWPYHSGYICILYLILSQSVHIFLLTTVTMDSGLQPI